MDLLNIKYNKINRNNNNILIVFSHIIDVNIEKLWFFLRDLFPSSDKSSQNFMFIKGNNTWKAGNKFTYYWSHIYKVKSETIDTIEENERKKISWKIETDFGFHYIKSCYLYKISEKEQTLLKIYIISEEIIPTYLLSEKEKSHFCFFNPDTLLDKKCLKEEKEKTISYESCIIKANNKDIWNLITDFKTLSKIAPIIGENIEKWGFPFEEGSFWKGYLKNIKKTVFLRVNKVKMCEHKKIWIYSLETIGTDKKIYPHMIELKIIKIEEQKCQLSITHKFIQKIKNNYLKIININKRDILKRIKKYFELNEENKFKYNNTNDKSMVNITTINNNEELIKNSVLKNDKL